jgi:hypothetical protein
MGVLFWSNMMTKPQKVSIQSLAAIVALSTAPGFALRAQQCDTHAGPSGGDSAYHDMQSRGAVVMGVDQYTSTHHFTDLPDGGRIELERNTDDSAGVAIIRHHLRMIADAFGHGDFSTAMFVHMRDVPGTPTMAARRSAITYIVSDLPRGGSLRMTTHDRDALAAVHQFLAFQRCDHRAEPRS